MNFKDSQDMQLTAKEFRDHIADGSISFNVGTNRYSSQSESLIQFKKPMESGNRRVRNATKVVIGEIKFDSKLESYMYGLLEDYGIDFEFQRIFELQSKFRYQGDAIRAITWKADFWVPALNMVIDAKGYPNDIFPLKLKMFKHAIHLGKYNVDHIRLPSTKKECFSLIIEIKSLLQ